MWWWGQAQGSAEQDACVAFAGGEVSTGPFRTKVTALVEERRAAPGALEHLGATMSVRVRNHGRLVWEGTSRLAGLEHGGLERAAAEARQREP